MLKKHAKEFEGIDQEDDLQMFEKWEEVLNDNLKFPLKTVTTGYVIGSLTADDVIEITGIQEEYHEELGLMAVGKLNDKKIYYPLCDLGTVQK